MYSKGMTSTFQATDKKTGEKLLNENGKPKMITYDLTRLNIRFISHKQKAFHEVSVQLDGIGERVGASKAVISTAKKIWHQIMESGEVTRAGIRRGIIANCLIYACKVNNCPRENSEISKAMRIPETEITKGNRKFKEIIVGTEVEWVLRENTGEDTKFSRLCSNLGLSWSCGKRCQDLYNKHDEELASINSKSRVAGIIAWVVFCELNLSEPKRTRICSVVNVCAPTLKRVFDIIKELESKKDA
jgi:transcription initiation factor TFIIIB Brf1 subunit/transcription initiation factor TFIIB